METLTLTMSHEPVEPAIKAGTDDERDAAHPTPRTAAAANEMDDFLASVERKAFRIAVYALHDEATALDVVQDAMLKLVEKYKARPISEWAPLFFTILNNRITDVRRWRKLREAGGRCISLFRKRDGDEQDVLETGLGSEQIPADQHPESAVYAMQLRSEIGSALDQLSERQRQVFILREWQGLSVRDTAHALGCSEGSIKQHHFRAMKSLRTDLAEIWNNE